MVAVGFIFSVSGFFFALAAIDSGNCARESKRDRAR
jgi:hypothetical protein